MHGSQQLLAFKQSLRSSAAAPAAATANPKLGSLRDPSATDDASQQQQRLLADLVASSVAKAAAAAAGPPPAAGVARQPLHAGGKQQRAGAPPATAKTTGASAVEAPLSIADPLGASIRGRARKANAAEHKHGELRARSLQSASCLFTRQSKSSAAIDRAAGAQPVLPAAVGGSGSGWPDAYLPMAAAPHGDELGGQKGEGEACIATNNSNARASGMGGRSTSDPLNCLERARRSVAQLVKKQLGNFDMPEVGPWRQQQQQQQQPAASRAAAAGAKRGAEHELEHNVRGSSSASSVKHHSHRLLQQQQQQQQQHDYQPQKPAPSLLQLLSMGESDEEEADQPRSLSLRALTVAAADDLPPAFMGEQQPWLQLQRGRSVSRLQDLLLTTSPSRSGGPSAGCSPRGGLSRAFEFDEGEEDGGGMGGRRRALCGDERLPWEVGKDLGGSQWVDLLEQQQGHLQHGGGLAEVKGSGRGKARRSLLDCSEEGWFEEGGSFGDGASGGMTGAGEDEDKRAPVMDELVDYREIFREVDLVGGGEEEAEWKQPRSSSGGGGSRLGARGSGKGAGGGIDLMDCSGKMDQYDWTMTGGCGGRGGDANGFQGLDLFSNGGPQEGRLPSRRHPSSPMQLIPCLSPLPENSF